MQQKSQLSEKEAFALFSLSLMVKDGDGIAQGVRAKLAGGNPGMIARLAALSREEFSSLIAAITTAAAKGRMLGPLRAQELAEILQSMTGKPGD